MSGGKPPTNAPEPVREDSPAAEPAPAHRSRFGKLPDWALLPREVAIGLAAIVAAGLVILLVLGWR
jgi:hypothetical protein